MLLLYTSKHFYGLVNMGGYLQGCLTEAKTLLVSLSLSSLDILVSLSWSSWLEQLKHLTALQPQYQNPAALYYWGCRTTVTWVIFTALKCTLSDQPKHVLGNDAMSNRSNPLYRCLSKQRSVLWKLHREHSLLYHMEIVPQHLEGEGSLREKQLILQRPELWVQIGSLTGNEWGIS